MAGVLFSISIPSPGLDPRIKVDITAKMIFVTDKNALAKDTLVVAEM
jgi:hypothetical protein